MSIDDQIVNVNEYELAATADDFVAAITALARRTESRRDRLARTFLGPLNEEIEAMASGIDVPITRCDTLAAGFSRT